MPHPNTKRRKIAPRRIGGRLTDEQREWLMYGGLLRRPVGPDPFPDDDTARAAWFHNRDELMAENRHPGCRPYGFWRYEQGRSRPHDADYEAFRVWCLPNISPEEKQAIEAQWLKELCVGYVDPDQDLEAAVKTAVDRGFEFHHIPKSFANQHLPDIRSRLAKSQKEADEFRRQISKRLRVPG
jgi:hypothetical protein